MKKLNYFLTSIAMVAMLFTSCSKEEVVAPVDDLSSETAILTFGAMLDNLADKAANKGHFGQVPDCVENPDPTTARVTISYGDVTKTVDVDILFDGENYYTDYSAQLEIPVSVNDNDDNTDDFTTVTLEEFEVYQGDPDDMDNLIWVAPVASDDFPDANFSGYVDNPLPFDIIVRPGVKKYVDVEVLCFDRRMVNQYGYLFFDIENKELIELCLFGNFCTPDGRHYTANYSVDVFLVNDDNSLGTQLYDDVQPAYGANVDGDSAAAPLCLVLPDDLDEEDNYYVEITLLNGNDYNSAQAGQVVKTLNINDVGVRTFFNSDMITQEYAHFFVNCDQEDIFEEPSDEVKNYKACLKPINDSGVVAITALSLKGNKLSVIIAAVNMEAGDHPQHIHGFTGANEGQDSDGNAQCPDATADANNDGIISVAEGAPFYGGILLPLVIDGIAMNFPEVQTDGGSYVYNETFILTPQQLSDIENLEDKVIVLHGRSFDGSYDASIPVACNQLQKVGTIDQ